MLQLASCGCVDFERRIIRQCCVLRLDTVPEGMILPHALGLAGSNETQSW